MEFALCAVPGGHTGGATPVPIPNTEVKPSKADATAAVRQWESRTLPGYKKKPAGESQQAFLFLNTAVPTTFQEERRWVLSGDINFDKPIKSHRHEQARFGPVADAHSSSHPRPV